MVARTVRPWVLGLKSEVVSHGDDHGNIAAAAAGAECETCHADATRSRDDNGDQPAEGSRSPTDATVSGHHSTDDGAAN